MGLWVKSLDADWHGLYAEQQPQHIDLPTYPFAGRRFWLPGVWNRDGTDKAAATHPSAPRPAAPEPVTLLQWCEARLQKVAQRPSLDDMLRRMQQGNLNIAQAYERLQQIDVWDECFCRIPHRLASGTLRTCPSETASSPERGTHGRWDRGTQITDFVEESIRAGIPAPWYAGMRPIGPLASFADKPVSDSQNAVPHRLGSNREYE
jgi:hypothetical protein